MEGGGRKGGKGGKGGGGGGEDKQSSEREWEGKS